MLFKLKQTFFIIFCVICISACNTRWAADSFIAPNVNKEQKKKIEIKQKEKRSIHKRLKEIEKKTIINKLQMQRLTGIEMQRNQMPGGKRNFMINH